MSKIKIREVIEGAEQLSLGISVVVAIMLGIGLGVLLKNWTGIWWMILIGAFFGICAGIYNIFLAYQKQKKSLDELKDDVRYKKYQQKDDEEDEQW